MNPTQRKPATPYEQHLCAKLDRAARVIKHALLRQDSSALAEQWHELPLLLTLIERQLRNRGELQ